MNFTNLLIRQFEVPGKMEIVVGVDSKFGGGFWISKARLHAIVANARLSEFEHFTAAAFFDVSCDKADGTPGAAFQNFDCPF